MLVDDQAWSVASRAGELLAVAPPPLDAHATRTTHGCVVCLATGRHGTVSSLAGELLALRASLERTMRGLELRGAGTGTHPTLRTLARREPTMGLRVRVGVPDERGALRALDGLRGDLPLLLALSANSPFWRGADTGFASMRAALLRFGVVPQAGSLAWDARLRPRAGTLEVRIMDAQATVEDVATMAALVQALVRHHAGAPAPSVAPEVLAENRFLAARDGMSAWFADAAGPRRPAADALGRLLEKLAPVARTLRCEEQLADAAVLAESPGYARQRVAAAEHGPPAVAFRLAAELVRGGPAVAAA